MSRGLPPSLPQSLRAHRVAAERIDCVCDGEVRFDAVKSAWFLSMAGGAAIGGLATFTWAAFAVFLAATAGVLLFGHSLGSHRKLVHDSYGCPKWLEYVLVYLGVQVGLAGPIGLLRQHELRDYAQRLPVCHDYLRHGSSFWRDAWWQLNCSLHLRHPPRLTLEPRIADDRFYRFLERTWMAQQLVPALLLFALGGWGFVFWGRLRARHRGRVRSLGHRLPGAQPWRGEPCRSRRRRPGPQCPLRVAADDGRVVAQQPPCVSRLGEVGAATW